MDYMATNLWWLPEWYQTHFELITILIALGILAAIFIAYRHRISRIPYLLMGVAIVCTIYGIGWYFRSTLQYSWIQWLATQWDPIILAGCAATFALFAFRIEKSYWGLRAASFMTGFCLGFTLWIGVYIFMVFYPVWAAPMLDPFHIVFLMFAVCMLYYGVVKHRKGWWTLFGLGVSIWAMFLLYWLVTVPHQGMVFLTHWLYQYWYWWWASTGGGPIYLPPSSGGGVVLLPGGGILVVEPYLVEALVRLANINFISLNLWWVPTWYQDNFELITILATVAVFGAVFLAFRHRIAWKPYLLMTASACWTICGIGWYLRHAIQYTWLQWFAIQWCPLALAFCTVTFALFAFQLEKSYWGRRAACFMTGFCLGFTLWIGLYVFMNFYPIWASGDWFHMGLLVFPLILLYYGVIGHRQGWWLILGLITAVMYMMIMFWMVALPNEWLLPEGLYRYFMYIAL